MKHYPLPDSNERSEWKDSVSWAARRRGLWRGVESEIKIKNKILLEMKDRCL